MYDSSGTTFVTFTYLILLVIDLLYLLIDCIIYYLLFIIYYYSLLLFFITIFNIILSGCIADLNMYDSSGTTFVTFTSCFIIIDLLYLLILLLLIYY